MRYCPRPLHVRALYIPAVILGHLDRLRHLRISNLLILLVQRSYSELIERKKEKDTRSGVLFYWPGERVSIDSGSPAELHTGIGSGYSANSGMRIMQNRNCNQHTGAIGAVWQAALAALVIAAALSPLRAAAQVNTTTVQGTVYRADGSPASGTVLLSWP